MIPLVVNIRLNTDFHFMKRLTKLSRREMIAPIIASRIVSDTIFFINHVRIKYNIGRKLEVNYYNTFNLVLYSTVSATEQI